jgi:hypothetical protein
MLEICAEMHAGIHVKWPLKVSHINENWNSSTILRKILKYQISLKSVEQF